MEKGLVEIAHQELDRSISAMPETVRQAARECPVTFEYYRDARIDDSELDEGILGIFEGVTRMEPVTEQLEGMPKIRLFLDNIWDYAGQNAELFRKEVRLTWLHEFGHYLGWDEDEINRRGLG